MNSFGHSKWYEILLGIAFCYVVGRTVWVMVQRWQYNKTHRRKLFLVQMYDTAYFFIEFCILPVFGVRWLVKRFKSKP